MLLVIKKLIKKIVPETFCGTGSLVPLKTEEESEDIIKLKKSGSLLLSDSTLKYGIVNSERKIAAPIIIVAAFSLITAVLSIILGTVNTEVSKYYGYFGAGVLAFVTYLIFKYASSGFKSASKKKDLKSFIIVSLITFLCTCGIGFSTVYYQIFKSSFAGVFLNVSAFALLYALVFGVVFSKNGKRGRVYNIITVAIVALFVAFSARWVANFASFLWPVKYCLAAVMLILMVVVLVLDYKKSRAKKVNLLKPFIILVVFAAAASALAFSITLLHGEKNPFLYTASTFCTSIFGGDLSSLGILNNTAVNSMLSAETMFVYILPLAFIVPGSLISNTIIGSGTYLGFIENGFLGAFLYYLLSLVVVVGGFITLFSFVKCYVDGGKRTEKIIAVKKWLSPVLTGLMLSAVFNFAAAFVNILNISFPGIFGIALFAVLCFVCHYLKTYYDIKNYYLVLICGLAVSLLMFMSGGQSWF